MADKRAIVLLSGGLDSMLAVRILQAQDFTVEAVNFQTTFTCCKDTAAAAARDLGVRLTVLRQEDDYIELVRRPKFGYGKGANPCVDCRIYMFQRARQFMEEAGAVLVASGEVLGQRPKSQKRRDLLTIEKQAGLTGRLLRPLSAKMLPPTVAEQDGLIDREQLYAMHGRSRKPLIDLAKKFGIREIPSPSTGCSLTEQSFSGRVFDLIDLDPASGRWDFELLNLGRHFRFDPSTKVIVGRRAEENEVMRRMFDDRPRDDVALLTPTGFGGPTAMIVGDCSSETLAFAAGIIFRYSKNGIPGKSRLVVETPEEKETLAIQPSQSSERAEPITQPVRRRHRKYRPDRRALQN